MLVDEHALIPTCVPEFELTAFVYLCRYVTQRNDCEHRNWQQSTHDEQRKHASAQETAQKCGFEIHPDSLKVRSYSYEAAVTSPYDVVLTWFRGDRSSAGTVRPHAVKVVVGIQRNQEAIFPRLP